MKRGVYTITCTINNTMYIGQSKNAQERFAQHRCKLRHGTHCNSHLQSAWKKYGEDAFIFAVHATESNPNLCDEMEEKLIVSARALEIRLFNIRPAAYTNKGIVFTEETKEKIRAKALSQFSTAEARAKHSMAYRKSSDPIRLLSPNGVLHEFLNPTEFAKEHTLSSSSVLKLLRGGLRSYKGWVNPNRVQIPNERRQLTAQEKEDICRRYQDNESSTVLMRDYGVSRTCIMNILKRRDIPRVNQSVASLRRWHP